MIIKENGLRYAKLIHVSVDNGKTDNSMDIKEELKTPYKWCVDNNLRVIDIDEWPLEWYGSKEKHFFEFPTMTKDEFLDALSKCKVKPNSLQRKTAMYLEYRMYGLVAYQLSGTIHAGIQFGHAVVDYGRTCDGLKPHEDIYKKWADKDKTFIILNGGTTNNNPERLGTLNQHLNTMREAGVLLQEFHEPDLNNALTSICFLVDERVWNRELYEDFIPEILPYSRRKPSEKTLSQLEEKNARNYKHWVEKVGGETNAFLRKYLRNLKLA